MEGRAQGEEGVKDHGPSLWSGRTGPAFLWANLWQSQASAPSRICHIWLQVIYIGTGERGAKGEREEGKSNLSDLGPGGPNNRVKVQSWGTW